MSHLDRRHASFGDSRELEESCIKAAYASRNTHIPQSRYSCFDPGNLLTVQEREEQAPVLLNQFEIRSLEFGRIFEIGSATGFWLRELIKWGVRPENLTDIDLLSERIEESRKLCPAALTLRCCDASDLPFPDANFDLVLQSTVFTSIFAEQSKGRIAEEMLRVLKAKGTILWYDFFLDNPANRDVRGVRKGEIREIFSGCKIAFRRVTPRPASGSLRGAAFEARMSLFINALHFQYPLPCPYLAIRLMRL